MVIIVMDEGVAPSPYTATLQGKALILTVCVHRSAQLTSFHVKHIHYCVIFIYCAYYWSVNVYVRHNTNVCGQLA